MKFTVEYTWRYDVTEDEDEVPGARVVDLDVDFVRRWQRARDEFDACQEILEEAFEHGQRP